MIYITLNGDLDHTINIAYTAFINEILSHEKTIMSTNPDIGVKGLQAENNQCI